MPAQDAALSKVGVATIPPEGPGLRVLDQLIQTVVDAVQRAKPRTRATLDVDATIIAAHEKTILVA